MNDYRDTLVKNIGVSAQIMGIMSAIFKITSGIASTKQVQFHNIFRNHSLAVIAITCSISMILAGMIVILGAPTLVCIVVMTLVLTNRYLGNFANKKIISKIYAANSMAKNFMRAIITILASILITATSSANAMALGGTIFFIVTILIILYMKPRVGLKPEEYSKQELEIKV